MPFPPQPVTRPGSPVISRAREGEQLEPLLGVEPGAGEVDRLVGEHHAGDGGEERCDRCGQHLGAGDVDPHCSCSPLVGPHGEQPVVGIVAGGRPQLGQVALAGAPVILAGLGVGGYLVWQWWTGVLNPNRPLMTLFPLLLVGGLQIVLFGFLRNARSTAIIAVSIPISLLVTFAPLNMLGVSLNIMSLGGLALGIGLGGVGLGLAGGEDDLGPDLVEESDHDVDVAVPLEVDELHRVRAEARGVGDRGRVREI